MQAAEIEDINDLYALALALEQESARRYRALSAQMGEHGQQELAELFGRLADHEEHHCEQVLRLVETRNIELKRLAAPPRWEVPLPGADYDEEAADVYQSTPYKALALAVHNEQRAFALYSHIAAHSADPAIREHAESLAREELSHAAILRTQRREAFHAGRRDSGGLSQLPAGSSFTTVDQLFVIARQLEARIAARLAAAMAQDAGAAMAHAHTLDVLEQLGGVRDSLAVGSRQSHESPLSAALADSERAFAFYDLVMSRTDDESVRMAAQSLSESALDRLRQLYS